MRKDIIMNKRIFTALFAAAGILTAAGCSGGSDTAAGQTEVNVFIAASLSNAMNEIAEKYEAENSGVKIIYNADSSGTLQTQIEEGAECDIFFSAAEKQMNELNNEGFIKSDTITPLLQNKVVLIKAAGSSVPVTGFDSITEASNLALAGEDVPVGSYAREIFENMGITGDIMAMDINEGANVTAVLTAVAEGANEVGIVYSTDAASMKDKVEIIAEAPEGTLDTPVIYPAALTENPKAGSDETEAAAAFLEYLKSDSAKAVFADYGFDVQS